MFVESVDRKMEDIWRLGNVFFVQEILGFWELSVDALRVKYYNLETYAVNAEYLKLPTITPANVSTPISETSLMVSVKKLAPSGKLNYLGDVLTVLLIVTIVE